MMSLCLTVGPGREGFVPGFIDTILAQSYDPKQLERCVTYSPEATAILHMLRPHISKFSQIKVAKTDRTKLPFVIPENNPACDINAQICFVATHEKIVRTDFEMRFINPESLNYIELLLDRHLMSCVVLPSWHVNADFSYPDDLSRASEMSAPLGMYTFVCSSFNRKAFIENRGVEEKFALGFAADDSYFHLWWKKNRRRMIFGVMKYVVIHLWHGDWKSPSRLKLKDEYTIPLYKKMLENNTLQNDGNPDWQRPEMISEVETWKV